MKFLILLTILWAQTALSNEHCESSELLVDSGLEPLMNSKCSTSQMNTPCSDCAPPMLLPYIKNSPKASKEEIQDKALKLAFDEYKKVMISNIVKIAKTRSLPLKGQGFSASKLACKARTEKDFEGCSPHTIKLIKKNNIFADFNKQIANEIAAVVSKKPYRGQETLLKRRELACFIPEQTALQVSAQVIEETFDSKLASLIQNMPKGKYSSVIQMLEDSDEIYDQYGDSILSLTSYTNNNPLMSKLFSHPDKMIDFFQSIPSPVTNDKIRARIYSSENAVNLDNDIAEDCNKSFTSLKNLICSDKFSDNEIDLDPDNNYSKIFDHGVFVGEQYKSEEFLAKKLEAKRFCPVESKKDMLNIGHESQKISSMIPKQDAAMPLENFRTSIYNKDLSEVIAHLCEDRPCTDMTNIKCRMTAKYKEIQKAGSYDNKLANSSNDEVNSLLRSMIASPETLDPQTRAILIEEGVLPDSKGNIVSTGNIPERHSNNFSSSRPQSASVQGTAAPVPSQRQAAMAQTSPSFAAYPSGARIPQATNVSSSKNQLPDFSDLFSDTEDLKRIQEEIRRRLMGGNDPSQNPKRPEEVKRIVRESINSLPKSARRLRPNTEAVMAQRILQSQGQGSEKPVRDIAQDKAAQALQDEKWEQELQNRALSNMHGVRMATERNAQNASGNSDLTKAAAKKDLTKVALNIPDDPRVNLTEVFGKKYNTNDPETQVLKVLLNSKNDFLLQINSLDFRVVFDETSKFRVLLQSGNPDEASKLRPQLELFLKRLNEKNS